MKKGKIFPPPDLLSSCHSPIPNIPLSIDNQFDGEGNNLFFANISSIILHCQNRSVYAALHDSVTIVTQCDSMSFGASLHFVCVVVAYLILQPIAYMLSSPSNAGRRFLVRCVLDAALILSLVAGATAPELNRGLGYEAISWVVLLASTGISKVSTMWCYLTRSDYWCCSAFTKLLSDESRWMKAAKRVETAFVFIGSPALVVVLCYRLLGVCENSEALFSFGLNIHGPSNPSQCIAHFGVGGLLNLWAFTVFLTEVKAVTMMYTLAEIEFRVALVGGSVLFLGTLIHELPKTWPNEMGVTDHQHLALYLVLMLMGILGIAAHSYGLRPKSWNVPWLIVGLCISTLLYFHDPNSKGMHKDLHQVVALTWLAAMVARSQQKHFVASLAGSVAGLTFASVTYAHVWMSLVSGTNYLGYLFYIVAFVATLYIGVMSVVLCGRRLGAGMGDGEPVVMMVGGGSGSGGGGGGGGGGGNTKRRGQYEMVGVKMEEVKEDNEELEEGDTDENVV